MDVQTEPVPKGEQPVRFPDVAPRAEEPEATTIEVLVLDDSRFDAMTLQRECRSVDLPVRVTIAADMTEFRRALEERHYHLVFIDYLLPDGDGLAAQHLLRSVGRSADSPVVMISGEARLDVAVQAMKDGCIDYKAKDELNRDMLKSLILRALEAGGRVAQANLEAALEAHRREIVETMRDLLREELNRLMPEGAQGRDGVKEMLQRHGLIPEEEERDWSDLLDDADRTFVFYKH
ncbi:response regulator [Pseudooceanicola sp. CBS1P-1]|uniref:Response regulator n=1 Tax=Pseudooceanicola albus TaxID=2692189 RepID=A0A6L7FXU6_9RHOB|nr:MULTISPECIES: response regulator [Pseudooceanicola]MBT9382362.1 response regulator [Pseudooceanicola endophyticus]MXN16904.1 response regulator [Pseudooceanicola albus]